MAKRIIILSSGPLFIVLVVIALVFVGIGQGQPVSIESARNQIITLADEGKPTEIDTAIDKLITDNAGNSELPTNLLIIADSFTWRRLNDKADRLYRHILDNETDTDLTTKARLGLTRLDILHLIAEKKFSAAREQVGYMASDFRDEPDCAIALFQIGQEFGWQRRYAEAKESFDLVIETFPTSPLAQEVRLWSARANICSFINNQKTKDDEIVAAIDKLIVDFENDSRLLDTLFWISREYEWTKGAVSNRAGWFDKPNSVYQQLMQKFGAGQAEWDYKRLSHRMKIFNLIKEPNQSETDEAIEEMVAEFAGRPEVAGELYWIACGYEEQPDKCLQAKKMYERIVKEYPDSQEADRATLEVQRRVITDLIIEGDMNGAEVLIDGFVADFKQHPYAGNCLGRVTMGYYKKGVELKEQKKVEQAKEHFERGANVWRRIKENNLLTVGKDDVYLCFYAGCTYQELGRWDEAITTYQEVLDVCPDFEYGCGIQAAIAADYEKLKETGQVPEETINPLIEEAFKAVLENYPKGCNASKEVAFRLAAMLVEKGDKDGAIKYYRQFLELAQAKEKSPCQRNDERIAAVRAKLAELEGANK